MQDLYSLLIPLGNARILVPRSCVAEVISFVPSADVPDSEHPWLLGTTPWSEREMPVISFEKICAMPAPVGAGRTRVVVFRCLGSVLEGGHFGMVTQGFPQLVRVNAAVLETDETESFKRDVPIICQLRMINQRPLIPDLEMLERRIAEAVTAPA